MVDQQIGHPLTPQEISRVSRFLIKNHDISVGIATRLRAEW